MSLSSQWITRMGGNNSQRAINLSNPNTASPQAPAGGAAVAINTTVLGLAAQDVQAELFQRTGLTYDETNNAIVWACCLGVTARLVGNSYRGVGGASDAKAARAEWLEALAALPTLLAAGTSQLTPTTDVGVPDFDRSRFGDIVEQAPNSVTPTSNSIVGLEPDLFS